MQFKTRRVGLFIDFVAQPTICPLFFGGAGSESNPHVLHIRAAKKQKTEKMEARPVL